MSFVEAVRSALSKYATFSGRSRRSEYWWFTLFVVILAILTTIFDATALGTDTGSTGPARLVLYLLVLLPSLAVSVRRLHDTGRSGWWILISLIPLVGSIILIVWFVQEEKGPNQHGPSPRLGGSRSLAAQLP